MNKIKTFLLTTLLALGLAGCGANSSSKHQHAYVDTITTPATCATDGVKTYTCNCGESYTEAIPATGHTESTEHVVATLDTPAYDSVKCSVCGEEIRKENEDAITVKSTVTDFATAIGISMTYSGSLNDGTPVYYTGGNFGAKEEGTFDTSVLINQIVDNLMPDFTSLTAYTAPTEDDGDYYALYTYTSDYTFLVFEVDAYEYENSGTTYIIAQFMGYIYAAA